MLVCFDNDIDPKDFPQSSCEEDSFPCGLKGVCIPNYQDGSVQCKCDRNYTGKPCSKFENSYNYLKWYEKEVGWS